MITLTWSVGVAVGVLLLAFYALTGPPTPGSRWFEQGAAAAGRIVGGEPWRAVTALTLHVDAPHVAGNALATGVLVSPIVQGLGPGAGLGLVLLSGAVANVLAATAHDERHVGVGASSATFGAIGILAALRLLPGRGPARRSRRPWIVLAASLLLLAMLGTSRDADVLTHALGLLSGGAFGLVGGAVWRRPPGPAVQWALVMLAALAILGCWQLALSAVAP